MDADPPTQVSERAGPTAAEALAVFQALCLKCLVTQTGSRLEDVLHEIETLRADVAELRCAVCADDWPVFAATGRLLALRRAESP